MEIQTIETAIERMSEYAVPVKDKINRRLEDAIGLILAQDIRASITQPPFDRSPLDGYAMRACDTRGASAEHPVRLTVIDAIMAGTASNQTVGRGEAIRLMTGAPIPKGADCVIRQEHTDYGEAVVSIYQELSPHENICDAGEDFFEGQLLAAEGEKIDASLAGILASAGVEEVLVYRRPKVALYTSGDELIMPGTALSPGKIYNSNYYLLSGRMQEWKMETVEKAFIPDSPEDMADAIRKAAGQVDLIVTTGGVSVGQKDIMHDVCRILEAKRLFWRVAVKPGAPTLAFVYEQTLVIALSGNPFGAALNLEMLVCPILSQIGRDPSILPVRLSAVAVSDYPKASGVRRFICGSYRDGSVAISNADQKSGILSSFRGSNCYVEIPEDHSGVRKGNSVQVWIPRKA